MDVYPHFIFTGTFLACITSCDFSIPTVSPSQTSHNKCGENLSLGSVEDPSCDVKSRDSPSSVSSNSSKSEYGRPLDAYDFSEAELLYREQANNERLKDFWAKNSITDSNKNEIELQDFASIGTPVSTDEKGIVESNNGPPTSEEPSVDKIEDAIPGQENSSLNLEELPTSIEMDEIAIKDSKQVSEEHSIFPTEPPELSRVPELQPYDFSEVKWLYDVSYENYISEILRSRFSKKRKNKRKDRPVSAILQMPEIDDDRKFVERSLAVENMPTPVDRATSPPQVTDKSEEIFQDCSEMPFNNSTFENKLEEPTDSESDVDSDTDETEYYSVSTTTEDNCADSTAAHHVPADERNHVDSSANKSTSTIISGKQPYPRIVKLEVPDYLAQDHDRMLNAMDLERAYISRHFGFYNPRVENRQKISDLINKMSRESEGFEIRTARISKRFFEALTMAQRVSFCEENINGNVILGSKNMKYNRRADVKTIKAVKKTVIYNRWKLPPENVTVIICPVKTSKSSSETPQIVYLIPVLYEYELPYTFILIDRTREDEPNGKEVSLFALSPVDLDYAQSIETEQQLGMNKTHLRTEKEGDEIPFEEKPMTGKIGDFSKKSVLDQEQKPRKSEEMNNSMKEYLNKDDVQLKEKLMKEKTIDFAKKSVLDQEERSRKPKEIEDVIKKYLKNPNDFETERQLRRLLPFHEFHAIRKKAMPLGRVWKKRKRKPWLVQVVKFFMGIKKDGHGAKAPKLDMIQDRYKGTRPDIGLGRMRVLV